MPDTIWKLAADAGVVLGRFEPSSDVPSPGDQSSRDYFGALAGAGRLVDAADFLAHLLPKREAIWWGCLCLWRGERPQPSPAADRALGIVVRWVLDPSDTECQEAKAAADEAGNVPAAFLAYAVYFCGTSMIAPGLPVVPPGPFLPHRTVAGAVQLAAARGGDQQLREFLAWGVDVADGKNRWN